MLRKERKQAVPEDLSVSVWIRECECDGSCRALWCEECCFSEILVNLNVTHEDRRQNHGQEITLQTHGNLKRLRDVQAAAHEHTASQIQADVFSHCKC